MSPGCSEPARLKGRLLASCLASHVLTYGLPLKRFLRISMDKKEFELRAARLAEVGAALGKIPGEVRVQAFELLKNYVLGGQRATEGAQPEERQPIDVDDAETFFSKFSHDKPADNVRLLGACLFSQFGAAPFATDELVKLASNVGLTIPERTDMTLETATSDGKKLFSRAGRGQFKPTVHGEAYFRKTYNVQKGTKQRPAAEA